MADPKGTEVNQAWIKYTVDNISGTYGRQRILQGNQRFIGGVGWRQNEQTYDGVRGAWRGGAWAMVGALALTVALITFFGIVIPQAWAVYAGEKVLHATLGVLVAALQAYVFTLLSMIYIGLALEEAH